MVFRSAKGCPVANLCCYKETKGSKTAYFPALYYESASEGFLKHASEWGATTSFRYFNESFTHKDKPCVVVLTKSAGVFRIIEDDSLVAEFSYTTILKMEAAGQDMSEEQYQGGVQRVIELIREANTRPLSPEPKLLNTPMYIHLSTTKDGV